MLLVPISGLVWFVWVLIQLTVMKLYEDTNLQGGLNAARASFANVSLIPQTLGFLYLIVLDGVLCLILSLFCPSVALVIS